MAGRVQTQTQRAPLLPEGMALAIRHKALEGLGILLVLLALAWMAALLSYHPSDPSWNTATAEEPRNWLGLPGASLADLMIQTLGLAPGLLAPLAAAWGYRLTADHRLRHVWIRLALVPLLLIVAAFALALAPRLESWSLIAGMGGVLGDALARLVLVHLSAAAPWIGLGLGAIALALLIGMMGVTGAEWLLAVRRSWGAARGSVALARKAGDLPNQAGDLVARFRGEERAEPILVSQEKVPPAPPREPPEKRPVKVDRVAPREDNAAERRKRIEQMAMDLGSQDGFKLPPVEILDPIPEADRRGGHHQAEALEQNARLLEGVLEDFGVRGEIVKVRPGPVVTLYELEPAPGTKTSRVIGLADDIARSMSALSVRIATVPGRSVIGIELPNQKREMVHLRDLLDAEAFSASTAKLPVILGKDIGGTPEVADLARMPHLLVAGTTGSGKSVGVNAMIVSLLYKLTPEQCRFIMIDPKMLELSVYEGIPHLLAPVVTDPKKAVVALKWTVREMEDRYRAMSKLSVRNIEGYNKRVTEAAEKGEVINRRVQTGFDPNSGEPIFEEEPLDLKALPYIVVVVDEMADLMLVAGKDIEASIQRLAQMARAAGIHIVMATQRPSVDVITGTIKANFPTRISFQVTSKIDSRTILGEQGGETLLGRGDMLYMAGGGRITRIHGPFLADHEVEAVCAFLKAQGDPDYVEEVTEDEDDLAQFEAMEGDGEGGSGDLLYDQAVAIVTREKKASTSFIQRKLQIGYNRAARIIEKMEEEGVVSPANHVGKREVLAGSHD